MQRVSKWGAQLFSLTVLLSLQIALGDTPPVSPASGGIQVHETVVFDGTKGWEHNGTTFLCRTSKDTLEFPLQPSEKHGIVINYGLTRTERS